MRRLIVLLILFLPAPSWAMEKFVDFVQDNRGNMITGVSVTVYLQGTTSLATIYSDNGVTTKANPFTNATDGAVIFYAANGRYDVVYSKVGYTFTRSNRADAILFDKSQNVAAIAEGGTGNTSFTPSTCIRYDGTKLASAAADCGVGGGGSGMSIGGTVTSGSTGDVLYVGAGPVLGQASIAGLVLSNSPGGVAPVAYAGTACTNQFVRSLNANGVSTCNAVALGLDVTGTLGTANGGTGVTDFTWSGSTHKAASASGTLTSGNLVKFDASGNVVDNGISITSLSGNTAKAATVSGSLVSGNCLKADASGNVVDNGSGCGAGGSPHALLDGSVDSDTTNSAVVSGDLIYGNATPKWTRLAKGTDGQVLKLASGLPSWAAESAVTHNLLSSTHSDTVAASPTLGDMMVGNVSSLWTVLAGNTSASAKCLTQTGTGSASALPTWGTCSSGVTSIATTSPITGGTITTTGTIACATCTTNASALTANLPVIGAGGQATAVGTRSGNTTQYVTTTGAQTSGDCVKIDASGNHVANGSACGGGTDTFTMAFQSGGNTTYLSPLAATTYYLTNDGGGTTQGLVGMVVPVASTLKAVYWKIWVQGSPGTVAQLVTHKLRKNNTTDSTGCTTDYSAAVNTCSETGLSTSYSAGDYVEFKITTPGTWTTPADHVRWAVTMQFSNP